MRGPAASGPPDQAQPNRTPARPEGNPTLGHALGFAAKGFAVIPLHTPRLDGTCDCRRPCDSVGKHPRTQHGLRDATTDQAQIVAWWTSYPTANLGVTVPDGYLVLDVDGPAGEASIAGLDLPATPEAATGKGRHLWFKTPINVGPKVGILPGVDLRGPGSYVVAPPSKHANGSTYSWKTAPKMAPFAPAPGWLIDLVGRPTSIIASSPDEPIPQGQRNATLASLAGTMRRRGMGAEAIAAALLAENAARCRPPLPEDEVRAIASSVARYEPVPDPAGQVPPAVEDTPNHADGEVDFLDPTDDNPFPAPPSDAAYHGVLGAIVRAVAPTTEADPIGILASLATMIGVVVGPSRVIYQGSLHACNLFAVLVGDTATGRKGTADGQARRILHLADAGLEQLVVPGLGSGEGLIARLKGRDDPRACVTESEFASIIIKMTREGSTLSAVLRDAYDRTPLGHHLASKSDLVTHHHVGLLGHITPDEIRDLLRRTDAASGFANRILWLAVERTRLVPRPVIPDDLVAPFLADLRAGIAFGQTPGTMELASAALDFWDWMYAERSARAESGLVAKMTGRGLTHAIRLAMLYAILDRSSVVAQPHLEAARAFVDYSERSVRWIFGASTGDPHADLLRRHLRERRRLTARQARAIVRGDTARQTAVDVLIREGLAQRVDGQTKPGGGRPTKLLVATVLT